ncbi:MAG: hypothetical protein QCI82_11985 [Candidatus Thermoplasmatota archaeon]|nr:hypothetical protein [Candidatus Thermoplasmatota archaeon]
MSRVQIPPGPPNPEKATRLLDETKLASMEEERKHAVEVAQEANAPKEEGRKEEQVV